MSYDPNREPRWAARADGLARLIHRLERPFDHAKRSVKSALGLRSPVVALPFSTYGTPERLRVHGRVLEDAGITGANEDDHVIHNVINMLRRYESDEVPGVALTLRLGDVCVSVTSDEEGYFEADLVGMSAGDVTTPWTRVKVALDDGSAPREAWVRVVSDEAEYGVISDMDDTVVRTGASTFFRHARTVLLNNAHSREPFDGIAALYQAFERGRRGERDNPIFYVSSSPWNLFDLFEEFLEHHEIPRGPIVLRDFGIAPDKLIKRSHISDKLAAITSILTTYPALSFVLVGDTGQKDAIIYRKVALEHPERVRAIYLRDLQPGHHSELEAIEAELAAHDVPMLRVADSAGAADHACAIGLIGAEDRDRVRAAVRGAGGAR